MNLYINLGTGDWSTDRNMYNRNLPLAHNQGDRNSLNVYFVENQSGPVTTKIIPRPEPYTLIHIGWRPASNLETPSGFIFEAGDFTEMTVGSGDSAYKYYKARLVVDTSALNTLLGIGGESVADSKELLWQLEFSNDNVEPDIETVVTRGKAVVYRDIVRGNEPPVDEENPYPAADQVAVKTGTNYRIVAGVLQMKNTGTNTWHALHLTGASGSEQLVIETAAA